MKSLAVSSPLSPGRRSAGVTTWTLDPGAKDSIAYIKKPSVRVALDAMIARHCAGHVRALLRAPTLDTVRHGSHAARGGGGGWCDAIFAAAGRFAGSRPPLGDQTCAGRAGDRRR